MSFLSNTILRVILPSGNAAVYSVEPRHVDWTADMNRIAIEHGTQIAHAQGGKWYEPGGPLKHAWHEITDLRTIALLERAPDAHPDADWRATLLTSARRQFTALFRSMSLGGCWHLYRIPGTASVALLREDAQRDAVLEVLVADVQAMDLQTMLARAQNAVA